MAKRESLRRYIRSLEISLEKLTRWAVFEPNGPALWGAVTMTVSDFLYNEWRDGRLLGPTPAEAFFVRCDLTTMTEDDIDNGRLVCLVGVAPVRPAEFVIFRISQDTGTSSA